MPDVLPWLLDGDPAIRWQALRDLCGAPARDVARARALVAREGWGAAFLARQDEAGTWAGALYSPKWTSTTYTLLDLRCLGLPPGNPQARRGCRVLLREGFHTDGGINFWKRWTKTSETCVTGIVLSVLAHFRLTDRRIPEIAAHLCRVQMADGGWNCQSVRGATHGSFHTTILALEALLEYERAFGSQEKVGEAQRRGREFLLVHRLFRSHRTGKVVKPQFLRAVFPSRWHYDTLRALDYFQAAGAPRDPRLQDAIAILERDREAGGQWRLPRGYPGRVWFEMEPAGAPSRWNTLRALRVLRWWSGAESQHGGVESAR
ncbi:MAG TPA: hypothetical protein DEH78_23950 [Solibacterales bacterium]|nr:hypothetical protein [Bryobacterales bacterium]